MPRTLTAEHRAALRAAQAHSRGAGGASGAFGPFSYELTASPSRPSLGAWIIRRRAPATG